MGKKSLIAPLITHSQAKSTKKLSIKDFFDEFFSSFINYDPKLLKTLYALLIKPGTITKDYIAGKRVRYTNSFRFLLSLAFIYFLMDTYYNKLSEIDKFGEQNYMKLESSSGFEFMLNEDDETTKRELNTLLDSIQKTNTEFKLPDELIQLDSLGSTLSLGKTINKDSLIMANPQHFYDYIFQETDELGRRAKKIGFFQTLICKGDMSSFNQIHETYDIADNSSNKRLFAKGNSSLKAFRAPGSFINATISKLPFIVFFFLPIFTVFILLVYIRKKYTYTDHFIFSFHNQSLLFILLILSWIINIIFNTATAGIFLTIFSIYLFQAMRKFFGQGVFKTIVKYLFLNAVFTLLTIVTIVLLFTGSVFTYLSL